MRDTPWAGRSAPLKGTRDPECLILVSASSSISISMMSPLVLYRSLVGKVYDGFVQLESVVIIADHNVQPRQTNRGIH